MSNNPYAAPQSGCKKPINFKHWWCKTILFLCDSWLTEIPPFFIIGWILYDKFEREIITMQKEEWDEAIKFRKELEEFK